MSAASIKRAACESGRAPLPTVRTRCRGRTAQELQYAILRVKNRGARMSIRAAALEAGVDPSLVHQTYPDIAEEIRALVGHGARRQRDETRADVTALRRRLHDVTAERDEVKKAMAVLVSANLVLHDQIAELRAELGGRPGRIAAGAP